MRKVLSFSGFLILGLVISQFLPMLAGDGYGTVKSVANVLLYVCLSFIMINVGREFVLDKSHWKSYAQDYFIAMVTAALPWFMIAPEDVEFSVMVTDGGCPYTVAVFGAFGSLYRGQRIGYGSTDNGPVHQILGM